MLVLELPRNALMRDVPELFLSPVMLGLPVLLEFSPDILVLLFPRIALIKDVPDNLLTGTSVATLV